MSSRRILWAMIAICVAGTTLACANKNASAPNVTGTEFPSAPQGGTAGNAGGAPPTQGPPADPWPRTFTLADAQAVVYQPQVESWQGNSLNFRAAVGITPNGATDKVFGVIWGTARTQVNREARMVSLDQVTLTRSNFPTLPDKGAGYLSELAQQVPLSAQPMSLDRLAASLAAGAPLAASGVAVKNEPPQIFVSYAPAILVPISGQPVLRPVPNSDFQRVVNTRAAILSPLGSSTWYLHVYDGWLQANSITGPYAISMSPPMLIQEIANTLEQQGQVDMLDGGNAQPKPSLANGAPAIFVGTTPSELLVFKGQPTLEPIGATHLLWVSNTTADVFVDSTNNAWYALLSGRWFTALTLNGPWSYVASGSLPVDFRNIPPGSPAGLVLASVAGTPQAREARIENSIPQTASVSLTNGPQFTPTYDGAPKLAPIAGTPLQYVINSPAPVIRVDANTWYALQTGVWFVSTSPQGPWMIATTVPAVIYTIPPSSPLHYVTYAQIYGSAPGVVYEGYTPGYLGTVVAPDGVVVYGTGYAYDPWIGTYYYPPPPTYEVMAQPVYNPAVGWTYGFGLGMTTAAMMDSWGEPAYYTSYYHGYPCCGSASANVYGHWGDTVTSGTRTYSSNSQGWYNEKQTGSYDNTRTGTTGTYSANRGVNPYTGQAQRGYDRSYDTANGTTGSVNREQTYNAQTGKTEYNSNMSTQTAGGSSVDRSVSASEGASGGYSVNRETTVDNAHTGQTNTYSSGSSPGSNGEDRYAGADGNVYHNNGSGWTNSQGQSPSDSSWADREQQARSDGDSRSAAASNSVGGGGWGGGGGGGGDRFGGGGSGGGGFGGGGFGGGGGGGWGSHYGGGGFGGRFGGGGGGGGGRR